VHIAGASGGFVTQALVYLLQSGRIQGAVVAGRGETPLRPRALIASSREELLACAGSRYGAFPWGLALRELASAPGASYAVVGIPCQIRSLYKAFDAVPGLREKVSLIIGLFCGSIIEPEGIQRLLRVKRASVSGLADVTFRDGTWPGAICAHAKDGTSQVLFPAYLNEGCQGVSYLKSTYGQDRCRLCPDYLNVLADISAGDPWNRGSTGYYEDEGGRGSTVVLARTGAAASLVREMADAGVIKFRQGTAGALLQKEVQGSESRRTSALANIARLRRAGRPAPDYGLELPAPEHGFGLLKSYIRRAGRALCHTPPVRDILMVMLFSWPGHWLTRINQRRKRKAWLRRNL
jgi:coenzyme F420 hydrogenase subunit beta